MLNILGLSRTKLKKSQLELGAAKQQLRIADTIFHTMGPSFVTNAKQVILRVNEAFTRLSGYEAHELIGKTPRMLQSGQHDKAFYASVLESIGRTGSWQGEIFDRHKNGSIFPRWLTISTVTNENAEITNFVATYTDLSEQKQAQETIDRLTFHDLLTNLPNRVALLERLGLALSSSTKSEQFGCLLHIDLDHFKHINDRYGHPEGDQYLMRLSTRLSNFISSFTNEHCIVARLGGDKFSVVLADLGVSEEMAAGNAEHAATELAQILAENIEEQTGQETNQETNTKNNVDNIRFASTASIGIVLFRGSQTNASDLLHHAELACYECKSSGGNTIQFFDPDMAASAHRRVSLEMELSRAIAEEQLTVYYQPQVTADGVVRGAEALVRWAHPERGVVSPAEFIPLAEETGQIVELGRWVLQAACSQLVALGLAQHCNSVARHDTSRNSSMPLPQNVSNLTIAVNVSAKQFIQPDFVSVVQETLESTGADPTRLKLELTESLFLDNADSVVEKMQELRAMGIGLSLDDFGTGYSSLAYLRRMPLDQLKIDQSFVRDVTKDFGAAAITQSLVAMAHSLGLTVVAEGVETEAQKLFLVEAGCLLHQGYLYSKPLPATEFHKFLKIHTDSWEEARGTEKQLDYA